jgi:hypothetical protein
MFSSKLVKSGVVGKLTGSEKCSKNLQHQSQWKRKISHIKAVKSF